MSLFASRYRRFGISQSVFIDESDQSEQQVRQQEPQRLNSIDAFRGLCIFLQIFVNYGSGGYAILDHSIWNGLQIADLVYPSFVFICGLSMALTFQSRPSWTT
jgi:heparan-alpha-glucosaminide N-acetyltransferase